MRQAIWILMAICMVAPLTASKCNDGCEPEQMRCHRERVEICNAGKNWEVVVDCLELEEADGSGEFTCIEPPPDTDGPAPEPTCEEVPQ